MKRDFLTVQKSHRCNQRRTPPAAQKLRRNAGILKTEIAEKVKDALKSMQGEGILTWRMRTMLLPDIRIQTEGNELRIEAYRVETEQRVRVCAEEIQNCAEETNSCLNAEQLIGFLRSVYSRGRCEE